MSRATRRSAPHEAQPYLSMALEFEGAARTCAEKGWWRASGTNAIHAAISAGDAVCIFELSERSSAASHDDAADLLRRSGAPGANEKAAQLAAVLRLKNRVEYEWRPIEEAEAKDLLRRAVRLVDWARGVVKA